MASASFKPILLGHFKMPIQPTANPALFRKATPSRSSATLGHLLPSGPIPSCAHYYCFFLCNMDSPTSLTTNSTVIMAKRGVIFPDNEINECIERSMEMLMDETCLFFRQTSEQDASVTFIQSEHCSWQESNRTVHLNPNCISDDFCYEMIGRVLSIDKPRHHIARHLNLHYNCTGTFFSVFSLLLVSIVFFCYTAAVLWLVLARLSVTHSLKLAGI
ncbi:hypothetical protein ANCCAN_09042 [Ancylostoma caninum]|uniref:Uncharacterized protein n=1 Tax=Ancylostoma caninum TaxID=29170 RepID=A0A368GMU0_ANCCA|nr:hypothetical protein ANCCAN_09042 [Ancylostoma caninum]